MVLKRKHLALLTCGAVLTACETSKPPPVFNKNTPFASLKAKKEMSPVLAHALQLLKEEKYAEASQLINLSLQSQPKSASFHVLNAFTYEKLAAKGDASGLELAAVGYQNAINLDPSNIFAITQLAKLKVREKQFGDAQELFANALLIKPNDADLLHELAAASYYSYDIKTAIAAISKAETLKPKDPLIHRSMAMIYAAVGDFETAKKHLDIFKAKLGDDPAVAQAVNRISDWSSLYKSGRIKLAAATSDDASGSGDGSGGGADTLGTVEQSNTALNKPSPTASGSPSTGASAGPAPQIIVDCYMLRIQESVETSKGNNILQNLAVTFNPGGFMAWRGAMGGTGVTHGASKGSSTDFVPDTGFKPNQQGGGTGEGSLPGAASVFTAGAPNIMRFANAGTMTGNIFASGITWAGLTYSLNIANAIDMRTEVISRPSLMTFPQKQSVFFSGSELVVGLAGQNGSNLLKYPVGVTLIVTPEALDEDLLTLNITVEGSLINNANPNLTQTVNVDKTRVDTFAKIRLGETLVLGGIYERTELLSKDGFPGLRDIPIAQYFFSNESTLSTRSSIVFMLTPRSSDIVKSAVNRAMSRDSAERKTHLAELSNRNPNWYACSPNLVPILGFIARDAVIYYEFRSGDIVPPSWGWEPTDEDKLGNLESFFYY